MHMQDRIYRGFLISKDKDYCYAAVPLENPAGDRPVFVSYDKGDIKRAIEGYWAEKNSTK